MGRVSIITDSTVCLPREVLERYGIHVVPLLLVVEDRVYRDGVDITPAEFYSLLPRAKKLPTTSSPSPAVFLEAYRQASKGADSILCITLSRKLGMVYDSACSAREAARADLPGVQIEVLDSETAGAESFIVLAGARAAAQGQGLAEVAGAARRLIPKVRLIGVLETLYYLAKGGRIRKPTFWAASILMVKPVFRLRQGEVGVLERPRTRARALERVLAIMKTDLGNSTAHVSLMHANVPEDAEGFKARVQAEFNCAELYLTDFTPVMGAHAGLGTLAVAY